MYRLYNLATNIAKTLLPLCRALPPCGKIRKVRLFADLQRGAMGVIEREMGEDSRQLPVLWLNVSSFEEYAAARPIIQQIQNRKRHRLVVTFFSPTGYETLHDISKGLDHLFMLPLDTEANARRLIKAVKPDIAVFMTSECLPNYLNALREEGVPTYLVSALIDRNSPLLKWWGGMFRHAYKAYTHIFVIDAASKDRLNRIGISRVTVGGIPLPDKAHATAKSTWGEEIVERFAHDRCVFVADSISDDNDLRLVAGLANRHRDTRFIIVPHEITPEGLRRIKYELEGHTLLYSECDDETDFTNVQVLVIDFLRSQDYIYRYASCTYIGGGLTQLSRSVVEATAYGVPMTFGPMTYRKVTPSQLIRLDIGCKARNLAELDAWFCSLKDDDVRLNEIRLEINRFMADNHNAAQNIAERIIGSSSPLSFNLAMPK